jgi:hypothetical protein
MIELSDEAGERDSCTVESYGCVVIGRYEWWFVVVIVIAVDFLVYKETRQGGISRTTWMICLFVFFLDKNIIEKT